MHSDEPRTLQPNPAVGAVCRHRSAALCGDKPVVALSRSRLLLHWRLCATVVHVQKIYDDVQPVPHCNSSLVYFAKRERNVFKFVVCEKVELQERRCYVIEISDRDNAQCSIIRYKRLN
ncbi:hypothetical protein BaRGS_00014690 [Batillaria attramentaria]|uniref:Uncharacterized protein n=1 Tax=Batillaria attramentaria TaxID=370345 RepID=A0ABD0L3W6_9CAEN